MKQLSVIKAALLLIVLISVTESLKCPKPYQVVIKNVRNSGSNKNFKVCGNENQVARGCSLYSTDGNIEANGDDVTSQALTCEACQSRSQLVVAFDPRFGLTQACATTSEIVPGCQTYQFSTNDRLTCQCNPPFTLVPLSDGSNLCTNEPKVQGCTLYRQQQNGQLTCVQCEPGYYVVYSALNYHVCTQTQIPNCLLYAQAVPGQTTTEGYAAIVCQQCQPFADDAASLTFSHPLYSTSGVACPMDSSNLANWCSSNGITILSSGLYACSTTTTATNTGTTIPNCQTALLNGRCQQCDNGYFIYANRCYPYRRIW